MKKFLAMILAIVGAGLSLWAGYCILAAGGEIYGYHPMYPGLLGLTLLTGGIITYQE